MSKAKPCKTVKSVPPKVWRRYTFFVCGKAFCFNCSHPWRCDSNISQIISYVFCFNSRTREGATRYWLSRWYNFQFQFTHPRRCDEIKKQLSKPTVVSIHAPVKVRRSTNTSKIKQSCFNSRTREGATRIDSRWWLQY